MYVLIHPGVQNMTGLKMFTGLIVLVKIQGLTKSSEPFKILSYYLSYETVDLKRGMQLGSLWKHSMNPKSLGIIDCVLRQ
jgi:hypothetical protein